MEEIRASKDMTPVFEKFLGIKTDDEEIYFGDPGKLDNSYYEASEYEGLMDIFNFVNLMPEDTLVDIGCGMGRVLFYCNQRFMCNVTGIEYDKEIYDRLCDNAEYYHVRFKNQRDKIKLYHMKAEDYDIKPEENFFYMFNPFNQDIMKIVLDKIIKSMEEKPRKITLILYYCTDEILRTIRKYPFALKEVIKLPAYRLDAYEKVYILECGEK